MPAPDGKVAPPYVPTLTHKLFAVLTRVIVSQAEAEPHKMEHIRYMNWLGSARKGVRLRALSGEKRGHRLGPDHLSGRFA